MNFINIRNIQKYTRKIYIVNRFLFKYKGSGSDDQDAAAIRAANPIPLQCGLFYFEIDILDKGENGYVEFFFLSYIESMLSMFLILLIVYFITFFKREIGVGFCTKRVNLNSFPGNYNYNFYLLNKIIHYNNTYRLG